MKDISRQAASLSIRLNAAIVRNRLAGSGASRDSVLRNRLANVYAAENRYQRNIADRMGVSVNGGFDGRSVTTDRQWEKKVSQRTYMGLANG